MEDLAEQDLQSDDDDTQAGKRKIKRWTSTEHDLLVRLVEQLGEDACWATIAAHIPGRSGKQCRERWVNHIGADIKKGGWTQEEESQVARLHATIGPAWTRIANALGGRTENSVKNHFNALLRSKRLEDKKTSILAQYVRIVRDKLYTGVAAYEQAIRLTQNAVGSSSQVTSSQPSSKARGGNQRSSQQGSLASVADGRSTGRPSSNLSPGPSHGPAGTGMQTIRTRMMDSPGNPSYSSPGGAGGPMGVGTPMSGLAMGDATAALAAAVAAVNAAAQAVAGVPNSSTQQFSGGTIGPGMSEGMTESMQYSGGSPGVLASLASVPAQSGSMSASLAEDGNGVVRGMRRTGRGGRGRPGYGHMPTLRDARSGGTPSAQAAQAAAADALDPNTPWQTGSPSGAAGSEASRQLTPAKGRGGGLAASGPQNSWIPTLSGASLPMLHGMTPSGYDPMQFMGLPGMGGGQQFNSAGMPQLNASFQDQMAQLADAMGRPGEGGPGLLPADSMGLPHGTDTLKTLNSLLLHQNSWAAPPFMSQQQDNKGHAAGMPCLQLPAPDASTPASGVGNNDQGVSRPGSRGDRGMSNAAAPNAANTPTVAVAGSTPTTPSTMLITDAGANGAGTSANSLTLGMHDLVGHAGFSVFGNQHNVDIGSPLSPASRIQGRISGPLGVPLFSQFPPHTSFNVLDAVQGENQEPLMGRLSGLSLDAMLASPASARTPSASALYFLQGTTLRQSRADGLMSASQLGQVSQHQLLLSPFHHQDKQDRGSSKPQQDLALPTPLLPLPAPLNRLSTPGSGVITDDLGLVMRPLHVKTRKGQASDASGGAGGHAPSVGGDAAAMHMATLTPASAKMPMTYLGPPGTMLMSENGTPTRAMVGEVFLTWTQEPCTPSHLLMGSPAYPVMQVLQGPMMSNPQAGIGGGHDSMFTPSNLPSFLHMHSEDHTPRDGRILPEISVPTPEVMGCLDIMFDDSGPPEPPHKRQQQQQHQQQHPGWHGQGETSRVKVEQQEVGEQRFDDGVQQQQQQGRHSPTLPSSGGAPSHLFLSGRKQGLSNGQLAQVPPTPQPWPASNNKRHSSHVWMDPYQGNGSSMQGPPKRPNQNGNVHAVDGPGTQPSTDSVATPVMLPGSPAVENIGRGSLPWAVTGGPPKRGPSSEQLSLSMRGQLQQGQQRPSKLQVGTGVQDGAAYGRGLAVHDVGLLPRAEQQALHSPV